MNTIELPQMKTCATCRHALTHLKCRQGCYSSTDETMYRHWEPGDAVADLFAAQLRGDREIHVDGEIDLWGNESFAAAQQRLQRVSEQCGYSILVGRCAKTEYLLIFTHDGVYTAYWSLKPIGELLRVRRVLRQGTPEQCEYDTWNRCGVLDPEKAGAVR